MHVNGYVCLYVWIGICFVYMYSFESVQKLWKSLCVGYMHTYMYIPIYLYCFICLHRLFDFAYTRPISDCDYFRVIFCFAYFYDECECVYVATLHFQCWTVRVLWCVCVNLSYPIILYRLFVWCRKSHMYPRRTSSYFALSSLTSSSSSFVCCRNTSLTI